MIKKDYMKPTMEMHELKHRSHVLVDSIQSVRTSGLKFNDSDPDLEYERSGDNQELAW